MRQGQPIYADNIRWLAFHNAGATEIPPFGLIRCTNGAFTSGVLLEMDQPNSDSQEVYVNGPSPVAVGGYGVCTSDSPIHTYYDTAGTPANGETWGAASGSYKLTEGKTGFVIEGGASGSVVLARRTATSSGGSSTLALTTRNVEGYVGTASMQQMGDNLKNFDGVGFGGTDSNTWADDSRALPWPTHTSGGGTPSTGIVMVHGSESTGSTQGASATATAYCATTTALPANTYANGASGVGATITANANGSISGTIDSAGGLSAGQIILVKDESSKLKNGLYSITTVGNAGTPFVLTRYSTMDTSTEIFEGCVTVSNGTVNAGKAFICANAIAPTVGTTEILYTENTSSTFTRIAAGEIFLNDKPNTTPEGLYVGRRSTDTLGVLGSEGTGGYVVRHKNAVYGFAGNITSPNTLAGITISNYAGPGRAYVSMTGGESYFGTTLLPTLAEIGTNAAVGYGTPDAHPGFRAVEGYSLSPTESGGGTLDVGVNSGFVYNRQTSAGSEEYAYFSPSYLWSYSASPGVGTYGQFLDDTGLAMSRVDGSGSNEGSIALAFDNAAFSGVASSPALLIKSGATATIPAVVLAKSQTSSSPASNGTPGTMGLTHASLALPNQTIDLSTISGKTRLYSYGGQFFSVSALGKKEVGVAQGSAAGQAVIWNGTNYAPGSTPYTDGTYNFDATTTGNVASITIANGIITGMTFVP